MHGAHPGHLAFKLLERLSLSPYFSPSLLSVPSFLARRVPPVLPFARVSTYVCTASLTHLFLFHPRMPSYFRLRFASWNIVSSRIAQFSNCATETHVTRRISVFFIPPGDAVIRTRTCFRILPRAPKG